MITIPEAIKIAYDSARTYKDTLQDTNLLIAFRDSTAIGFIQTLFYARHFMHLTGLRSRTLSAVGFYRSCLKGRLKADDIYFSGIGTTELKLRVLPHLLTMPYKSLMIGKSADCGFRLYTDTFLGTTIGSIGFIPYKGRFYVPNTVLKEDVRKLTIKPGPLLLACSKKTTDEQYITVHRHSSVAPSDIPAELQALIIK
ncbi:MAG: hypothetical protein GX181_09260 [Synergistaceae bacterium]|nr:hypothetical protein [Synergistaceae bacterium]